MEVEILEDNTKEQRQQEIHNKGFNLFSYTEVPVDDDPEGMYKAMKIKSLSGNATVTSLSPHSKVNPNYGNKSFILRAIYNKDYSSLVEISEYYYGASGIYSRLCEYLALLYKYDWYVTPIIQKNPVTKALEDKVLKDFHNVLYYFDNSDLKRLFGNIALNTVKSGKYYGIILDLKDKFTIQQLPSVYCRSRYSLGNWPIVELNMKFFDAEFPNPQYRLKILQMFPKEIQKAYILYKEGKLMGDTVEDGNGWYMLDPDTSFKFSLNDSDAPILIGAIPSIIDLDQAQELDRKKTMQQLLKIIVQKLPLDKNGDLLFDVDEAKDIHNNAVGMLKRSVGTDVLTTFAEVEMLDMQDRNVSSNNDNLQRVERTVYNNLGVSQNLFNTEGNTALEKSILNDEAMMRDLIYQFQSLLNKIIAKFNKPNNYRFQINILETTIYNYKEMSKLFKEHTQIGYSKMLPQIALGNSQSSIIATAKFENEILHLSDIMVPPMMSSTMSGKVLDKKDQKNLDEKQIIKDNEKKSDTGGRPEKPNEEKSDKTIQNLESQS